MRDGKTLKVIGLLISGVILVGGAVASGYKAVYEAREYTDENIKFLRTEQAEKMDEIQGDVTEMKEDIAVIRTIIEERFSRSRRIPE